MSRAAHPQAMAPSMQGSTRTAPPQKPASWPSHPRMRVYTLFGATGLVYLLIGLVVLRMVWALGAGPEAWQSVLESNSHPLYVAFNALCLVSVIFVAVRFFRLFPKAQPAAIGPLKPPPGPVIHGMLYLVWAGVTLVFGAILAGVIF